MLERIDDRLGDVRIEFGQSLDAFKRELLDCPELLEG